MLLSLGSKFPNPIGHLESACKHNLSCLSIILGFSNFFFNSSSDFHMIGTSESPVRSNHQSYASLEMTLTTFLMEVKS